MSAAAGLFHTAVVEHRVPGPHADLAAVAYNLEYTAPDVRSLLDGAPPVDEEEQRVRLHDHVLVRRNLYGTHPSRPSPRLCAIGIGESAEQAGAAARRAWFGFHASVLFTEQLAGTESCTVSIEHRVPGMPVQRARAVGVGYELPYLETRVEEAVARNMPTDDEVQVVESGEHTLMRMNLRGRHPIDRSRPVTVGGIADRHYRALAAAEQAWRDFHTSLLFAAAALGTAWG